PSHPDQARDAVCELSLGAGQHLRVRAQTIRNAEHRRDLALIETTMTADRGRASAIWIFVVVAVMSVGAAGNSLPLVDAVKTGNVESVRALLKQRVDVNATLPDGTTALHWAAEANANEIARL